LETFAACATIEDLDATHPNLKALVKDLLDWPPGLKSTQATSVVVKAVGAALVARTPAGVSCYAQAVEMLGFVAAASPLLEPDRIARIIAVAPAAGNAYAPERYTLQLSGLLRRLLTRYTEARREQILVDLWTQSHGGRFWDMTSGVVSVTGPRARRGADPEHRREEGQAAAEAVADLLAGANRGTPEAHASLGEALISGTVHFRPEVAEMVAVLPYTPELGAWVGSMVKDMARGGTAGPDQVLLSSYLAWTSPKARVESPITWLTRTLIDSLRPTPEADPDWALLPPKPRTFTELFPVAPIVGFPYPAGALALEGQHINGVGSLRMRVELICNAETLAENRDYMGNCTYGYLSQLRSGRVVLVKAWLGDECLNIAWQHNANGQWTIRDMNTRFNAGNVPGWARTAAEQVGAHLGAPLPGVEADDEGRRSTTFTIV